MYSIKKGNKLCTLAILFVVFWGVILLIPQSVMAETELVIRISDPDKPEGINNPDKPEGGVTSEGNTINTVLSQPVVSYGENRELGTLRISGKPGIAVPLSPGQKIMISLPKGTAYMQIPRAETYKNYVEWPETINGKKNQIKDGNGQSGIKFLGASPSSLTLEVGNIDRSGEIMIIDIVFNQEGYSKVRVASFTEFAADYSRDTEDKVSRLQFFSLLNGVTMPFPSSPLHVIRSEPSIDEKFSDTGDMNPADKYKIVSLVNAGFINGYEGGYFKADQYITRAEAVSVLGMIFSTKGEQAMFNDQIPAWAQAGINSAYAANIVNGYPDGSFRPEKQLTKQEAVYLLQQCLETYSYQRVVRE
ncbi:MAG: S-layer homology domain-containing protein [Firmicutes bacterium HGW-Firmicutes-15]|nr:MAG: S-layer homology domain-containing protein [Firmicutes bacterium HGW-Firmicutes-15]